MIKRMITAFLASLILLFLFSSCKVKERKENIIDDNSRNWYEIFVHSFYDTNNDGIGDLRGVTEKLDYIRDMGFTGIWLMPVHPSPTYHKYDVNDYYAIAPEYGTLEDMKTLIKEAHKRDIKVILDLVVNHTSVDHPWFTEACKSIRENGEPSGKYGDYYNFIQKQTPQYSSVAGTSYYYESRFWSGMPDLNLDSEALREEIVEIMRYWLLDFDADGFRLDAVTSYYTGNVEKSVDFIAWLNGEAKKLKPDSYIVGEAWEGSDYQIGRYYESGADSFFLFTGAQAQGKIATLVKQGSGRSLGKWMEELQESYGENTILAPFLGNHDTMRPGSFMPGRELVKMAGGVLAMMNGGSFVYYGEEIGMISKGGTNSDPAKRIAMKWEEKNIYEGCCYLPPENTAWDESSYYYPSVAEQREDPESILNYYKKAMKLRNQFPEIARGTVENISLESNSYICAVRKTWEGKSITIIINLDSFEQTVSFSPELLGKGKLVGELSEKSTDHVTVKGGDIKMPPYSIAIFE